MADYSILIVDDNESDRYLLRRHLEQTHLDIKVFEAEDGAEACRFFENYDANRAAYPDNFPPLVVFLDINMPIMDGWEFLESFSVLRALYDIQSSLVVMFTSSNRELDREQASQFSFVEDFVVKGEYTSENLASLLTRLKN